MHSPPSQRLRSLQPGEQSGRAIRQPPSQHGHRTQLACCHGDRARSREAARRVTRVQNATANEDRRMWPGVTRRVATTLSAAKHQNMPNTFIFLNHIHIDITALKTSKKAYATFSSFVT